MRFLPLVTAVMAAAALTLGFGQAAQAAPIDGAITGVQIVEPAPHQNDLVTTAIQWRVPNDTEAGDTFTLTLSSHLDDLPLGFGLDDPATGARVANAVLSQTSPAVITFTMTDYASTHRNTSGTAFVKSGFDNVTTPTGVATPFTFTTGSGAVFTTVVTPVGVIGDRATAIKYGVFTRDDQGRTNPAGFLGYHIDTPVGPFDSASVSDTNAGQSWTFDCTSLEYFSVVTDADYRYISQTRTQPTAVTCTPTTLAVTWPAQPALTYSEIYVTVSLPRATGLDAAPVAFSNQAAITTTTNSVDSAFVAPARNIQSSAGGMGQGTPIRAVPAPTPTPTTPAPTPTAPAPTAVPTPGTPAPAGGSGTPAIVPAVTAAGSELAYTGSNALLPLGTAGILLLAGAALVISGRRRSASRGE